MSYTKPKSKIVAKGVGVKKTKKTYAACGDCQQDQAPARCAGGVEGVSA